MATSLRSSADVLLGVRDRFRALRLGMNLSQEGLAKRSGVSLGSLKRFERTGLIAFDSLLKLALVLSCLDDFDGVGVDGDGAFAGRSLDDILAESRPRKKGRLT